MGFSFHPVCLSAATPQEGNFSIATYLIAAASRLQEGNFLFGVF